MAGIELTDFRPFEPVGSPESVGTRREWRISNGKVRGIAIRERNKSRRAVGWYDRKSPGWREIEREYEAWRGKRGDSVGTPEQSLRDHDTEPTGADYGNVHDLAQG